MKTYVSGIVITLAMLMPFSAVATPDFMKQNIGSLDCGISEIAKFNGAAWECSADLDALSQAIEEVGDLGCSATQQDNSVLITCGDGTAGVIAGAGTVVLYPEGQIGQVPPIEYNTGPIVAIDGSGVVLGEVEYLFNYLSGDEFYIEILTDPPKTARLISLHSTQEVFLVAGTNSVYYLSDDCSGIPFINPYFNYGIAELDGRIFISFFDSTDGVQSVLFKSQLNSGGWQHVWNSDIGATDIGYIPASECIPGDVVHQATPASEYLPAPEITNAVYPVRVEQLP